MGSTFGTLDVIVYDENDKEKTYYRLNNNAKHYKYLPPNIYEFERALVSNLS